MFCTVSLPQRKPVYGESYELFGHPSLPVQIGQGGYELAPEQVASAAEEPNDGRGKCHGSFTNAVLPHQFDRVVSRCSS